MANIIKQHNSKVLNSKQINQTRPCNCRNKENCPLNGECLSTNIVYKAEIITKEKNMVYYGTSESEFKFQYNNHTKSCLDT